MERVPEGQVPIWKEKKADGAGVDGRLLPLRRDARGRRALAEDKAISERKDLLEPDFPLSGPKLAKEFFRGMTSSGQSLVQHRPFE